MVKREALMQPPQVDGIGKNKPNLVFSLLLKLWGIKKRNFSVKSCRYQNLPLIRSSEFPRPELRSCWRAMNEARIVAFAEGDFL